MDIKDKQYHSYIIKGVTSLKTDSEGWRIVGLWGDEDMGEGYRIGPTFKPDQLELCDALIDRLIELYGLPVKVETIMEHFRIKRGDIVDTPEGRGVVDRIATGPFPISVTIKDGDNYFTAWVRYEDCNKVINHE